MTDPVPTTDVRVALVQQWFETHGLPLLPAHEARDLIGMITNTPPIAALAGLTPLILYFANDADRAAVAAECEALFAVSLKLTP